MTNFVNGWYVIYTRPRHEAKVTRQLGENNIPFLLPTRKVLHLWRSRKKLVTEPLFPSYIFVYLDGVESYYSSSAAEGVLYYVRTGKTPSRVSDTTINNLRLVTDHAENIQVSADFFQSGKKMVIGDGAFAGLDCELVSINSKQQILVRVDLLKRNLLVALPRESLIAV